MRSVLIVVYFGKFNNYFQLFLNSCKFQKNFDFMIITDDLTNYNYPNNCKVIYSNIDEFITKSKKRISEDIDIRFAQKLCDYKPTYGYMYENLISDYNYWGYVDVDTILGNLDKLLQPILELNIYDKVFNLGHLTLFKNTKENNRLFFNAIEENGYSPVFSNYQNFKFDEEFENSISNIFLENEKKVYMKQLEADIYTKSNFFFVDTYDSSKNSHGIEKENNLFIFNDGNIINFVNKSGVLYTDEYLYIHLQKRGMEVKIPLNDTNSYKIIPNAFEPLEISFENITVNNLSKIKSYNRNNQYFKIRFKNLKSKFKSLMKGK